MRGTRRTTGGLRGSRLGKLTCASIFLPSDLGPRALRAPLRPPTSAPPDPWRALRAASCLPTPAHSLPRRGGGENFRNADLGFDRAAKKIEEDLDAFPRGEELGDDGVQALECALRDFHCIADAQFRIEGDDFFVAADLAHRVDGRSRQCGDTFAKSHDAADARGVLHLAMESGVDKACEKVAGKHCFDEPDGAAAGTFAKAKARAEAFDGKKLSQASRRDVFVLWARPQAEPERLDEVVEIGDGEGHWRGAGSGESEIGSRESGGRRSKVEGRLKG